MRSVNAATKSSLIAALLCGVFALSGAAQKTSVEAGPERLIQDFYRWYVQAIVTEKDPLRTGRAQLRHYATDRLLHEIEKMRKGPDGLDGDYFLDAQDVDREWAKNIHVSNLILKAKTATADVRLRGSKVGTRNLHVTLVQEQGAWKVDKVEGR